MCLSVSLCVSVYDVCVCVSVVFYRSVTSRHQLTGLSGVIVSSLLGPATFSLKRLDSIL